MELNRLESAFTDDDCAGSVVRIMGLVKVAVVAISAVLLVSGCSVEHAGAAAIEKVANESVFVDTHPGLDDTPVFTSSRCRKRSLDGPVSEGGITRFVAKTLELDPWLSDLARYYAEKAEADGWRIVELNDAVVDSSEEPLSILVLHAERLVEGTPMVLKLQASIENPGRGTYHFDMHAAPKPGTFCS